MENFWMKTWAEHSLTEITTALFWDPSPKVKEMKAKINKWATQVALLVKHLPAKAEDIRDEGSIPELGRYSGEGHDNPL